MAWEKRKNGRRYYTRSHKVHGHVIREYIGSGILGEIAAYQDQLEREKRNLKARLIQKEQQKVNAAIVSLNQLYCGIEYIVQNAMQIAGYHQHHRGEWRRKRKMKNQVTVKNLDKLTYDQLVELATNGNKQAFDKIKPQLDSNPRWIEKCGSLFIQSKVAWIDLISSKNLIAKQTIAGNLKKLQAELSGPSPTPIETLLIERILLCYLQLHYFELLYVQKFDLLGNMPDQQKRLDQAQRRYLASIKTLALVRRLGIPVMQVNISEKQLNVIDSK